MLGPLCEQTDKRYSFVKYNEDYALLNNNYRNHTNKIFYKNIFRSIDQSIDLCVILDACHELLCVFRDFYASGT